MTRRACSETGLARPVPSDAQDRRAPGKAAAHRFEHDEVALLRQGGQHGEIGDITAAEKQDKNNYLEDVNSSSIGGAGTVFMNSAASSTFNDVIVCINPDMSLSPDCN